jgi:hypothetical protein
MPTIANGSGGQIQALKRKRRLFLAAIAVPAGKILFSAALWTEHDNRVQQQDIFFAVRPKIKILRLDFYKSPPWRTSC